MDIRHCGPGATQVRFVQRTGDLRWTAVLATIILMLLVGQSPSSFGNRNEGEDSCLNRLQKEAPAGWTRLGEATQSVTGTETITSLVDVLDPKEPDFGKTQFHKQVRRFWINDKGARIFADSYDRTGKWLFRNVYCYNPDYAFTAKQLVQGGPYVLTQYGRDEETYKQIRKQVVRTVQWLEVAHQGFWHPPLKKLLQDKSCSVTDCHEVAKDGRSFIFVELTYPPTGPASVLDPSTRHTKVLLDPGAEWRVLSDTTVSDKENNVTEVIYDTSPSQPAWVGKVLHRVSYSNGKARESDTYEFSSLASQVIAASEFRLPAIGLPELPTERARDLSRLVIAGVSLIVLGTVLFLFYHHLRRRRA